MFDDHRYISAMHGIQSYTKFAQHIGDINDDAKNLRVGITSNQITDAAVAAILISKGICTLEEYQEQVMLEAEAELARCNSTYPGMEFA